MTRRTLIAKAKAAGMVVQETAGSTVIKHKANDGIIIWATARPSATRWGVRLDCTTAITTVREMAEILGL